MSSSETARIPFADGDVLIDQADLDRLEGRAVYIGNHGYPVFSTERTGPVLLHLFVLGGRLPGKHVDHLNGDGRDCRRANLRAVSPQVNQINRHRLNANNSSGVRGVSFHQNAWCARIKVNGRTLHLGRFNSKAEAAQARKAAEAIHFPEMCPEIVTAEGVAE